MDQDAIVVKRIKSPAVHRFIVDDPKEKQGDLCRIPSGLPEDRSFDLSSHFEVIQKERFIVDDDVNSRIQREGTHCNGAGSEEAWYAGHKGYSKRLP